MPVHAARSTLLAPVGIAAGLSLEDFASDGSLMTDLGRDSLDHAELILGLEEEFGVAIQDEDAAEIHTVADAIRYIVAHRKAA
jgi:acyl carrier protein